MKVIIPLAGPDFVGPDGVVKSEHELDGVPLLRRAIEGRSWWRNGSVTDADLVFTLHDDHASRRFVKDKLALWYPAARTVFVSDYARGAAFSALAGCSVIHDIAEPICFDLADILFECDQDPLAPFFDEEVGAVALTFLSDNPVYSYLRRDEGGKVVEAAEKRVISNEASAGVYFFRSMTIYLKALAHVAEHSAAYTHNNLFFLCPVYNGILAQGLSVEGMAVMSVYDIKAI